MYYRFAHRISWNIHLKKIKYMQNITHLWRGKRRKQEAGLSTSDPSEVYKPYNLQYMNFRT